MPGTGASRIWRACGAHTPRIKMPRIPEVVEAPPPDPLPIAMERGSRMIGVTDEARGEVVGAPGFKRRRYGRRARRRAVCRGGRSGGRRGAVVGQGRARWASG